LLAFSRPLPIGTQIASTLLRGTRTDSITTVLSFNNAFGELNMNWDQVQGNWKQIKGKAQQKWGDLTDDDLDRIEGNRKELAGIIQERYGKTREAAEREVDQWRDSL
jgi:uncharacterized protein YjbJ (UPF0337 family)